MADLKRTILAILEALPYNRLISQEELDYQLMRCERADAETKDITEALREIDAEEGLVSAFMATCDMLTFGVALKSKVTRSPDRALVAVGFEPRKEEVKP